MSGPLCSRAFTSRLKCPSAQEHELLRLHEAPCLHPVEVDAARKVSRVKFYGVRSGILYFIQQRGDFAPEHIVDWD